MSNFLTKRKNHNDINNFLPDNKTIATADYFKTKFSDKLPEYYYKYLECVSREEYNEDDVEQCKQYIINQKQEFMQKLDEEYNERFLDGITEELENSNISDK